MAQNQTQLVAELLYNQTLCNNIIHMQYIHKLYNHVYIHTVHVYVYIYTCTQTFLGCGQSVLHPLSCGQTPQQLQQIAQDTVAMQLSTGEKGRKQLVRTGQLIRTGQLVRTGRLVTPARLTLSLDSTANRPRATTPERVRSWSTQDG